MVYGKKPVTPDGRRAGAPFGPVPTRCTVVTRRRCCLPDLRRQTAVLPTQRWYLYTFSIVPNALGKDKLKRKANLAGLMDGYFHHEANPKVVST